MRVSRLLKEIPIASNMTDRYKLSQFYQGKATATQYSTFQTVEQATLEAEHLQIVSLAMDFPGGTSQKLRHQITNTWISTLPTHKKVTQLSVRGEGEEKLSNTNS